MIEAEESLATFSVTPHVIFSSHNEISHHVSATRHVLRVLIKAGKHTNPIASVNANQLV